ncbi:hypothetical protein BpHYR1_043839, partial [Brachionus plicatilis]
MSITTDNAKNMSNITKNIQDQFRKIHQLGCIAHVLSLIIKKINNLSKSLSTGPETIAVLNFDENIDTDETSVNFNEFEVSVKANYKVLVEKCRKIARLFHQSTIMSEILEEKQIEYK